MCRRRLRTTYAKRTGKREASVGVEENQSIGTPSSASKRKRKLGGESDDDEDDDDDSDDQAEEEDEEEEEEMKKVRKVETYDEVKQTGLCSAMLSVRSMMMRMTHCVWFFIVPGRMRLTKPPVWRSWRSRLRRWPRYVLQSPRQ